MIFQDDRTPKQVRTMPYIVLMTDAFMSGWGAAKGGPSYAGWACLEKDIEKVERWVRARSDARRVRIVGQDYHPPSGKGHCHIYVVDPDHPAVQ